MKRFLPALLLPLLILSGSANAQEPSAGRPPRWGPPLDAAASARLARRHDGWQGFRAQHPGWTVRFDGETGRPCRAFGPGVPSFAPEAGRDEVATAARRWRDRLAPLLYQSPAEQRLLSVQRARRLWTVHFRQECDGVPVLDCGLSLRFDARGRLVFWGGRSVSVPRSGMAPVMTGEEAVLRAAAWLEHEGGLDRDASVESRPPEFVLHTVPVAGRRECVPCWRILQRTQAPEANWVTLLDARSGRRIAWWDGVRSCTCPDHRGHDSGAVPPASVTGTVQATTHDGLSPRVAPQPSVLSDTGLVVDGTSLVTDAAGGFAYVGGGSSVSVTADLDGPWVDVVNVAGPQAALSTTVGTGSVTLGFDDSNSTPAERDVAFFVNRTHAVQKLHAPGITVLDVPLVARVGHSFASCNAYYYPWDDTINFLAAFGSCIDTATSATVVHHEVGHALTTRLWALAGRGIPDYFGEALSDVVAAACADDPAIGAELYYAGDPGRSLVNTCTWPASCGALSHQRGRVYGGAFWDTRLLLTGLYGPAGRDLIDGYFFEHLVTAPSDETESLLEMLLLDDDDGDLTNGTPNLPSFHQGFTVLHGIPFPLDVVRVEHQPLRDTADGLQPLRIEARLTSLLPTPPASCRVVWSVDGGADTVTPLSFQGGDLWSTVIPVPPAGSRVRYHIEALSAAGDVSRRPVGAPEERYELFTAPREQRLRAGFEVAGGWSITPGSLGSTWERGAPAPTAALDPPFAWEGGAIWGNDIGLQPGATGEYGLNENSALLSPPFDLGGLASARLVFRRWLRVPGPTVTRAAVEVTGPGVPWSTLWENVASGANGGWITDTSWTRQVLDLPPTLLGQAGVQVRFVLQSFGAATSPGWNLDDVRVEGVPQTALLAGTGSGLPGQPWTLTMTAPPGTPYLAFADLAVPTPLFVPGLGTTSLSPFSPTAVVLQGVGLLPATVGATGQDALTLVVPAQPGLAGLSLGFQAVTLPGYDPARATISNLVILGL